MGCWTSLMSVMMVARVSRVASVASMASDPKVAPVSGMASSSTSGSTPWALPPRVAGMVAVGVSQSVPHLIRGCCSLAGGLSGCRGWKCH